MNIFKKTASYIRRYGVKELYQKANEKIRSREDYDTLRLKELISEDELEAQRHSSWSSTPVISIVMPVYNTPDKSLIQTLNSVLDQTYQAWELCIADGGADKKEAVISQVMGSDHRLKYTALADNLGISGNSNAALALAEGDYIAFLDHDDILEPDALYEMAKLITSCQPGLIYTDEDKVTEGLDHYFAPYRKPDYNPALLLSNNYICHFTAVRKAIIDCVGGFREEFDGAQDYDMILRCVEKCDRVEHISRVLYHWRVGADSTSDNPFNKQYAFDAGRRAIESCLVRRGMDRTIQVKELRDPGYFRLTGAAPDNYRVKKVYRDYYESAQEIFETEGSDYTHYLLLKPGMLVKKHCVNRMLAMASIYNADVIAAKIISGGRYLYNGIARAGNGYTQVLKGKPHWYRGRFNIALTAMNVNYCAPNGILVTKDALEAVMKNTGKYISCNKGPCAGMVMVYSPESVIEI